MRGISYPPEDVARIQIDQEAHTEVFSSFEDKDPDP